MMIDLKETPTINTVYDQSEDGKWYMSFVINGLQSEESAIRAQELLISYVCAGEMQTTQKQ